MTEAETNEIIDRIARRFEIVQRRLMQIIGVRIGQIADGLDVSDKAYIDVRPCKTYTTGRLSTAIGT